MCSFFCLNSNAPKNVNEGLKYRAVALHSITFDVCIDEAMQHIIIPWKCSSTNQLITAKDHASVQFNIGLIDESGVYNNEFKTVSFAGYQRKKGATDQALNRIMLRENIIKEKGASDEAPKKRC